MNAAQRLAPATSTFNTSLFKNGVNVALSRCITYQASSTTATSSPRPWDGRFTLVMLVAPWDTTVRAADLLHMVESKRCSDSGRVLLRKFNRVVVGLHWCARLRHDCCYRSKDPVQRSWREQSIGRTTRPIRNVGLHESLREQLRLARAVFCLARVVPHEPSLKCWMLFGC